MIFFKKKDNSRLRKELDALNKEKETLLNSGAIAFSTLAQTIQEAKDTHLQAKENIKLVHAAIGEAAMAKKEADELTKTIIKELGETKE